MSLKYNPISGTLISSGGSGELLGYAFKQEPFEVISIVNNEVELSYTPASESEMVVSNGITLTRGLSYDYTIDNKIITFNAGVVPSKGHITIFYHY